LNQGNFCMNTIDKLVQKAVTQQSRGNIAAACDLFAQILAKNPTHAVALYSLAAISLNQGDAATALSYAERSNSANPASALTWFIRGSALRLAGRRAEAVVFLERACVLDPAHTDAQLMLGVVYAESQQYRPALSAFDRVLALEPGHGPALANRSAIAPLVQTQLESEAVLTQRALALQTSGQVKEAEVLFRQALDINPNQFVALYSLAVIGLNGGKAEEGLHFAERCRLAEPRSASSWYIHGAALKSVRRFAEAMESLDRALGLDSSHLESFITKGHVYGEQKQYALALVEFNNVLSRDPGHAQALNNAATLLSILNQHAESARFYERLATLHPDFDFVQGALSHARLHSCDWDGFYALQSQIVEGVRAGKKVCRQLAFLAVSDSSEDQLKCARMVAEHSYPRNAVQLWRGERYNHKRIRVGYLSPDLREHPVGHLFAGVMEKHDKERFEIYAFSLGVDDGSSLRRRFLAAADHFVDVRAKPSLEVAQIIRQHEVDILIDLAGPTMDAQPDVFGFKPAPVQVLYLGYPGTSGAEYMDYILADRTVIPEGHQKFYAEKVLYLPGCYLPTDPELVFSERTPSREEMSLPEEGFVFCSFNHDYKINPPVFDVWMRILTRVEGSVLWLMRLNSAAEENLRKEAEKRGIARSRLIFATRVPSISDHLARYRLAGLFLDTTPYNAHTTSTDALRAGLPVLTVEGGSFQSRVATSVLRTVGMPELAVRSLAEYEETAVRLAQNPKELEALKERVRSQVAASRLSDATAFTSGVEAALLQCRPA
jgi:predicted O-linked N-acetylglucosamine transferase (SPINDLY family)